MLKRTMIVAMVLLAGSAALAENWQIPLTCPNDSDAAGWRPITVGVPLLPGQSADAKGLYLYQVDGNKLVPLPAQFRVLARWWRKGMIPGSSAGDNSVRWLLVDTAVNVQPKQKADLILTNQAMHKPTIDGAAPPRIGLVTTDDTFAIDTGAAKFVINRKKFNLIDQATVVGAQLLKSSDQTGGVIEDTYGNKYYASAGTTSVELVDAGPLRVQVRAKGKYIDPTGTGYSRGMYRYDVLMNFYAGRADVYVDYVIVNNAGKSIGSPTFEDASVVLKLAGVKSAALVSEADPAAELALGQQLSADQSLCLYQDSNGSNDWNRTPGVGHMHSNGYSYPEGRVTSFQGYRVYKRFSAAQRATTRPDDGGEVVDQGARARGLLVSEIAPQAGRFCLFVPKFWQLLPKALEVGGDGTIRLGVLPRETKVVHYLEDTAGCGTEFVLSFQPPSIAAPASRFAEWTAATWDHRLMPRPPVAHSAACGALGDLGPYSVPTISVDKKPDSRVDLYSSRSFTTDKLYGNAFGWQVFGERWRSNGGHGRRGARQPIDQDNHLFRWLVGGVREWFDVGDARSRHFRDVRVYQIDITEQDPFSFADWNAFRAANRNEDWTNRPQPKDEEYQKYTAGRYSRSDWPFPNPEHTTIDLLYDRYLLFGDVRAQENMRIGAAHGGYFSGRGGAMRDGWPWRANGWGMRALFRYWDLTADPKAEACLKDVVATHAKHIGTKDFVCHNDVKKEQLNWWFTNVYSRGVSMIALHTGDGQMLELLKTLADGKEKNARQVTTLFATLYHLTGDEQYRKLALGDDDGGKMLTVGGYFPACDHWLLHQPPAK